MDSFHVRLSFHTFIIWFALIFVGSSWCQHPLPIIFHDFRVNAYLLTPYLFHICYVMINDTIKKCQIKKNTRFTWKPLREKPLVE